MTQDLLDILYNQKPICETLLKSGAKEASFLFHKRAQKLHSIPAQELPILRCIFLNSLNKSIYNFILFAWDISLAQCCFDNKAFSHHFKEEKLFLEAGDQIISSYSEHICSSCPKTFHVQQACQYIDAHLGEEITLDIVARHIFVSKSYLSQMFREITGQSFSEYIACQRVVRARRLLLTTSLKVDQIAEQCGFFSSTYFSTVFKKNTGMAPRAFRSRYGGFLSGQETDSALMRFPAASPTAAVSDESRSHIHPPSL